MIKQKLFNRLFDKKYIMYIKQNKIGNTSLSINLRELVNSEVIFDVIFEHGVVFTQPVQGYFQLL